MNISNVVIKTEAMSEWRRYLKWRILTLAAGLGIMEVCSSNEMGAPNASHLEQETTQPNRPKQTKISPGKRASVHKQDRSRVVGNRETIPVTCGLQLVIGHQVSAFGGSAPRHAKVG